MKKSTLAFASCKTCMARLFLVFALFICLVCSLCFLSACDDDSDKGGTNDGSDTGDTSNGEGDNEEATVSINITYYTDNATVPKTAVYDGDRINYPDSVKSVYGYTFNGLYTEQVGGNRVFSAGGTAVTDVTEEMTLYARYTPWEYTFILETGEGSLKEDSEESFTADYNSSLYFLPVAERYGYNFLGWKLGSGKMVSEGENVAAEFNTVTGTAFETSLSTPLSVTLIAVYEKIELTVTFNYQGTDVPDTTATLDYGAVLSASQLPTLDTGSKYIRGWSVSATEFIPHTEDAVTENMTLYAFWTEYKSITLHRGLDLGERTIRLEEGKSLATSIIITIVKEHYDSHGWFDCEDFSTEPVDEITYADAKTDYYFKWTPKQYTITYDLTSAGEEIEPITYTYGDTVNLYTLTKTGHKFDGWYISSALSGTPIKKIDTINSGSYTLYAGFTPETYTLNLNCSGGECEQSSASVVYGQSFKLPVPKKNGHTFQGWYTSDDAAYTDKDGNSLEKYESTSGQTLYAHWELTTYLSTKYDGQFYVNYVNASGNFPAKLTLSVDSNENIDVDYLISQGYRCRATVKCKIVGGNNCEMTLKLLDGNGNKLNSTNWGDKVIKGGQTYDFSHTFDIASIKKMTYEFSARKDGIVDVSNSYYVSNFEFIFDFYKP